MENPDKLGRPNPEATYNLVIRSAEDMQTVRDVEAQINEYIDSPNHDYAQGTEAFLDEQMEKLNSLLPSSYENNCSVIGKVYYGDELEIESDQYSFYSNDESNTNIVALRGVDFHGFELREIPGQAQISAFLMFTDLEDEGRAYYFLPEDIADMSVDRVVDTENLRRILQACAIRQRPQLGEIQNLEPHEQYRRLAELAGESSAVIESQYRFEKVVIEADTYYRVEYSTDYKTSAVRVDANSSQEEGRMSILPTGTVRGCDYLELVVNQGFPRIEKLEIEEPCIVLMDDKARPIYMIPISEFRDAMII